MMGARAYISIAGSDDTGWRVMRVPTMGGAAPEQHGPRCRDYATAVAQAGDVSRILGVPRVLPTYCPVCGDVATWCDVLAGRPMRHGHVARAATL